ncbi:unnamed protein product [Cuscuta campestris]|uniref:Uncharacterized protein n=1 Tax=Cuscuta campestris TaxID=132261 RepID=A0A484KNQ7_9ASTE|nr:unnamed protein product [Cuscuta campestris]
MAIKKTIGASVSRLTATNLTWFVVVSSAAAAAAAGSIYSPTASTAFGGSHYQATEMWRGVVLLSRPHLFVAATIVFSA